MGGTISDWIIELKEYNSELADDFHTIKLEDNERLKQSGLPIFNDLRLPYSSFIKDNKKLMSFLFRYDAFCIRALPRTSDLPRKYDKDNICTFEDCLDFLLNKGVKKGRENDYDVLISGYEISLKSGIILSRDRYVNVEIGDCECDELSHGHDPCLSAIIDFRGIGHITDKTKWKIDGDYMSKQFMFNALRYIELSRDSFNPLYKKGYFEFVLTTSNKIKFLDYKINEAYLK